MPDRDSERERSDRGDQVEELRQALEQAETAVERERRRSRRWEREAVFRASTVAARLGRQILAGQRLANAVERHLGSRNSTANHESATVREALNFYRDARTK